MDPNWFYSTMAQSAAALVGLAGGFLVQRILAHRGEMATERAALRSRAITLQGKVAEQRSTAHAVIESVDLALQEIEKLKAEGSWQFTLHSEFLFTFSHGKGYGGDMVPSMKETIAEEQLRDLRQVATDYLDALPADLSELSDEFHMCAGLCMDGIASWLTSPPPEPKPAEGIEPSNFWKWLPHQRALLLENWNSFVSEANGIASDLLGFEARLLPATLWSLWLVLLGMLVIGVIAPMTYLSAKAGNSKMLLLLGFVPLSLGFLAYIAFEFRRIRRGGDLSMRQF